MKHIRGLVSTTQALRHIFLSPLQASRPQFLRYSPFQVQTQLRSLYAPRRQPSGGLQGVGSERQIRDEDIGFEYIQLVNEEGNLDPPEKLKTALAFLDRPDNYILQVSPGSRDRPPVCKIMNKRASQEREKARAKAAKAAKTSLKQIELNWAIDSHDLSHRLKQMGNFLSRGLKVEVSLIRKKGKRAPTVEEIKNVMDSVMEAAKGANAMQVKPMEGEPGKFVKMVLKKKDE